jgi:chromosome segregation ATPase
MENTMAEDVKVEATPVVEQPVSEPSEVEVLRSKLAELETSFQAKVNQASRAEREKYEKQLAKAQMSAEERLKAESEEKLNALLSEVTTLKTEKKHSTIRQQLAEAQLPSMLANDSRLVNAEVDDIPTIIKSIKKEFSETLKEITKPAVVGTAPKSPIESNAEANAYSDLVKKYPHLKGLIK